MNILAMIHMLNSCILNILLHFNFSQWLIFAGYFENFTFNLDTINFTRIVDSELSSILTHNSSMAAFSYFVKQCLIFELIILSLIFFICLFFFKYNYKLTWSVTFQKNRQLKSLIKRFMLICVLTLIVRYSICNYDVEGCPSRLRFDLIHSRKSVNLLQNMISASLITIFGGFSVAVIVFFLVWNKNLTKINLRPLALCLFLGMILARISLALLIFFGVAFKPYTIFNLYIENWYDSNSHILGTKDLLSSLCNPEYWNFRHKYTPFLLTDLHVIIGSILEVLVWASLYRRIRNFLKQWRKHYPCLLNTRSKLEFEIHKDCPLVKKTKQINNNSSNLRIIDETFVIQFIYLFMQFVMSIGFEIFLFLITEDIGFLANDRVTHGASSNYTFILLTIILETSNTRV